MTLTGKKNSNWTRNWIPLLVNIFHYLCMDQRVASYQLISVTFSCNVQLLKK